MKSTEAELALYQAAVNGRGVVDPAAMGDDEETTRRAIVNGYAAEFVALRRTRGRHLAIAQDRLYADLGEPGAVGAAARWALVSSRYRNAGGCYDLEKVSEFLRGHAPDLVGRGVGRYDVHTLGACWRAIRRGSLTLGQCPYMAWAGLVDQVELYGQALEAVARGDLGSRLPGAPDGLGNSGSLPETTYRVFQCIVNDPTAAFWIEYDLV